MRWTPGRRSSNIEDRRAGGGMGMRLGIGGTVVVLILSLLTGRNLFQETGATVGQAPGPGGGALTAEDSAREEPTVQFVSFVLDDAQQTWARVLPAVGVPYQEARLVLFRDAVQSGCGTAQSAMGPFYCPADQRVYIDLGFYDDLRSRFGAPGDFAQAYVLAHEIGHHVQHLMGTDAQVRQAQQSDPRLANELSVRLELQADCYAGVWAHSTAQRQLLERGDAEEGMAAAAAVGDDRIQRQTTGSIDVDSFTHGSSEQRTAWFQRGMTTGDVQACDTFSSGGR
ncbi:MAG TPA: neutral zinc metallopeptidase [Gemmatimonadaceae bacterium]|nr:neutral zinc metallopeptidase [Gemmatimonadaceae bacterium]